MNVGALDEGECPLKNCCGGLSHDLLGKLPGKDLPREVVHDGVEVDLGAVEKADHGDVQMPPLVGRTGSYLHRRPGRMNPGSGSSPASLKHQSAPRRRGGEDLSARLSMKDEGTESHMAEAGIKDVAFDLLDLLGGGSCQTT